MWALLKLPFFLMLPTCYHGATKIGNEPKFYEILSLFTFSNDLSHLLGFVILFFGTEN